MLDPSAFLYIILFFLCILPFYLSSVSTLARVHTLQIRTIIRSLITIFPRAEGSRLCRENNSAIKVNDRRILSAHEEHLNITLIVFAENGMFPIGRTLTAADSRINTLILTRSRVYKCIRDWNEKSSWKSTSHQNVKASIPHLVVNTKSNLQRESRVHY